MSRPPVFSVEDKFRLVLAVIGGEMSVVEAARRGKASEQSMAEFHNDQVRGEELLAAKGQST